MNIIENIIIAYLIIEFTHFNFLVKKVQGHAKITFNPNTLRLKTKRLNAIIKSTQSICNITNKKKTKHKPVLI